MALAPALEVGAAACAPARDAGAQPLPPLDEYHVRVFDADAGLPLGEVRGLAQTGDGYLYVAGGRGIVRFDGRDFRHVPLTGLPSDFVWSLYRDGLDRLWVRTAGGDIGYVERGRFRALPRPPVPVREFTETADGAVWLGSYGGLVRVRPEADEPYTHFTMADGLPSDTVGGVFDLPDDERVVVTAGGLAHVVGTGVASPYDVRFEPFGPPVRFGTHPSTQVRADAGGLWVEVEGSRVLRYHAGRFASYAAGAPEPDIHLDSLAWDAGRASVLPAALGGYVRDGIEDRLPAELSGLLVGRGLRTRDGTRWLVLREPGVRHVLAREHDGRFDRLPLREHLDFKQIAVLLEDHEGSLWVGTDRGLLQLSPRRVFALTRRQGLREGFTVPVLQTSDGAVWVGTWGGGLHRFTDGGLADHLTTANGLPNDQVRALFQAADGRLWVGMSGHIAAIRDAHVVARERVQGEARAFAETPDGRFWVGTARQLLVREGGAFVEHRPGFWHDRSIWALHAARDGSLWIGSERGLFRLAGDTLRAFGAGDGLRSPFVVAIHEEADGTLWFSTYGRGLHRWRDGRMAVVTTADGLHHDGVWRMLPDGAGGVWMSSDQGVWRVDHARLHAVADARERGEAPAALLAPLVFTRAEGMPSRECNRASPGGWRLADGRLVFNNLAGLVVIDPARATGAPSPPRTVLQAVEADGQPLPLAAPSAPRLPAGTKQLAFDFSALSFVAPEQNRFRYRMDGYDRDWVAGGTQPRASYTNLAPGRYVFRVQGASGASGWSDGAASYAFVIEPFVWQTWWFRLLVASSVVATLAGGYQYRVGRLLELQRVRLGIASDLHDDIGSSLSSIALMSEMLERRARPDAPERRQLRRINQAAAETMGALRDIIWLVDPAHDQLTALVERLRAIANDMLGGTEWTFESGDTAVARPLGMYLTRNVLLLYKEALHNVVRHARARRVTIMIGLRGGGLVLRVEDDGVGFAADRESAGYGLESMRRRARQAGGRLDVQSAPGRGTRLILSVPLNGRADGWRRRRRGGAVA